ncbi:MAG: hypothetical protein HPZ91_14260 [Lentisphaeria bacterium]|nr:hypothetical protein [Lentisphaeria bacterium]
MKLLMLLSAFFCAFALFAETLHEWKFTDRKVPGFNPLQNKVSFRKSAQKTPDGEPAGEVCILNEPAAGAARWSVQLNFESEQQVERDAQYRYSFWIKSDRDAVLEASFLQAVAPWKNFGKSRTEIAAGKEWKKVSCKTVSNYDFSGRVRVMLVCGTLSKGTTLTIGPIKLEKISEDTALAVSPIEFLDSVGSVGGVYTDVQSPSFRARAPFPAGTWTLENRKQERQAGGEWNPEQGVTLEPLAPGYYFLKLASGQKTVSYPFCVVKDPSRCRPAPDSPYAIDSAISWCAAADKQNPVSAGPKFEFAADLIRLGGFPMARDRFSWRWSVRENAPDDIVSPQYDRCGRLLAERGIPRLNVFHDSPEWTRTGPDKLPHDLGALYHPCGKA